MIKEYTNDTLLQYLQSAVKCIPYARGITAFVLNHNYKAMYDKLTPYMEVRNNIIMKYGELQDDGTYNIEDSEKLENANSELQDYAELKISIDIIKIPEVKMADSNLTANQMMSLSWMTVPSSADDIRTILCIGDEEEEEDDSYDVKNPPKDDDRF